MKLYQVALAAGLALTLDAAAGFACGYCAEDKVASVYDHAVVKKALGNTHHVAFFHIDGVLVPGDGVRRAIQASAQSVEGVDRGSVRISLQNALDRKLAPKKLSLFFFQVMDRPGELKSAKR